MKDGEEVEKKVREVIKKGADQKTPRALVENFRDELTGGRKINLADAYEASLLKPRKNKMPSARKIAVKREAFRDFVEFMNVNYPDITNIASVLKTHAEAYIAFFQTNGRFIKDLSYVRNGRTIKRQANGKPSGATVNFYLGVCREVFKLLANDAGIIDNPFSIPKQKKEDETRDIFTKAELDLIEKNADDFTRPLFLVALNTALREGDICTLKWSDVDFDLNLIRRVMHKTNKPVEIPMFQNLRNYLLMQKIVTGENRYVFPEHAKMYLQNPSGVSYRIKQFLESLGIETTIVPAGRTRAISVKDLHSCRHTFCYNAGREKVPLVIVQAIVGHLTPEMTRLYMQHATREDKQHAISTMRPLMTFSAPNELPLPKLPAAAMLEAAPEGPERAELRRLADTLPLEVVKEILDFLNKRA